MILTRRLANARDAGWDGEKPHAATIVAQTVYTGAVHSLLAAPTGKREHAINIMKKLQWHVLKKMTLTNIMIGRRVAERILTIFSWQQ